jgi:hypothetical protein
LAGLSTPEKGHNMADIIGFLKRILGCREQEMQRKIDEMLRIQLEMSRKLESMQPSKEETYYNSK